MEAIKQIIGSPSDFGIGWIIILLGSLVAIVAGAIALWNWASGRWYEKSRHLQMLSQLDTGAHISYFMTVLGNPVSISSSSMGQEYIFVNKYFYVQAVTNVDGSVSLFSVTTRRKDFNPVLKSQFGSVLVILGKTTFAMVRNPKRRMTSGDHGAITYYCESFYFGYDGGYRVYFFSINPNGFGRLRLVPASFQDSRVEEDTKEVEQFRAESIINTYTISTLSGPNGDRDLPDTVFGPKHYQVRVFG